MTEEAKKEQSPRPRIELVFTGKCLAADKKEAFILRENLAGTLGESDYILPTKGLHGSVGLIYSFEYEEPADPSKLSPGKRFNSYWPGSQRYVGQWANAEERAVWHTQARAFDLEQAAKRERKKEESVVPMLDVLEPLRKRYSKTNYAGKLAIEVLVLAYLRRSLSDFEER